MNYATTKFEDVLFSFGFPLNDLFEGESKSEAILVKDENGFYVSCIDFVDKKDRMKEKGRMNGIETVADAIAFVNYVKDDRADLMESGEVSADTITIH